MTRGTEVAGESMFAELSATSAAAIGGTVGTVVTAVVGSVVLYLDRRFIRNRKARADSLSEWQGVADERKKDHAECMEKLDEIRGLYDAERSARIRSETLLEAHSRALAKAGIDYREFLPAGPASGAYLTEIPSPREGHHHDG